MESSKKSCECATSSQTYSEDSKKYSDDSFKSAEESQKYAEDAKKSAELASQDLEDKGWMYLDDENNSGILYLIRSNSLTDVTLEDDGKGVLMAVYGE